MKQMQSAQHARDPHSESVLQPHACGGPQCSLMTMRVLLFRHHLTHAPFSHVTPEAAKVAQSLSFVQGSPHFRASEQPATRSTEIVRMSAKAQVGRHRPRRSPERQPLEATRDLVHRRTRTASLTPEIT